jgi:WD40 repeat protein
VAIAPSLAFVVSASFDTTVRLWRLDTGTSAGQLKGHTDRVTSVAVSPDSSRIVSGSADSTVRVWDAVSRKLITIVTHHDKDKVVWAVAVAPDDTYIASCSSDKTVRITSMHEWKLVATLRGHTGYVAAVAIAADGSFVASAGNDGDVRIWSMPSTGLRKIYSGRQFFKICPPPRRHIVPLLPNAIWLVGCLFVCLVRDRSGRAATICSVNQRKDFTTFVCCL